MKVLLATDGSRDAGYAGVSLKPLGWGKEDHLVVLTVIPDYVLLTGRIDAGTRESRRSLLDEETRAAEEIVGRAAETLRPQFGSVETRIYAGPPAHEILQAAAEVGADLIAVGSRGRSVVGEWLLGSVARSVLEGAACPVLVGRHPAESMSRVLLAYDGSPEAEAALQWIMKLPLPPTAHVEVVSIVQPVGIPPIALEMPTPPEYFEIVADLQEKQTEIARSLLDRAVGILRANRIAADGHVRIGETINEIAAVAHERCVDLLLIGAHARQGWIPDLLGNTTRGVLKATRCSVLVARTAAPVPSAQVAEAVQASRPGPPDAADHAAGLAAL